jgi:hypothetical protein
MKTIPLAVLVVALGLPALGQDAQPTEGVIDAAFSWSGVDLTSIPAPGGGVIVVTEVHLVLTANQPGLVDRLAGRCLLQGRELGGTWKSTGSCALADADGDMLFEDVVDENDKGRSVLTGGTGKFAGITGAHEYTTTWFSSIRAGVNQGTGVKKGHWRREAM